MGTAGSTAAAGRWVLHLDLDAFFASVEQLTRPTLADRPVLVGGVSGRGVVAGASYQARRYGARSAMPMAQARRLVGPTAVMLPPRFPVYAVASQRVFAIVREHIPLIEMLSMDEAFGEPAELVGATSAAAVDFAQQLRAAISARTGLTASVGLGGGKQTAKIASGMAKPDGVLAISPREQDAVLRPLSVRKLWGVGPVTGDKLQRLGIETIGDLADLSDIEVTSMLGPTMGPALAALARGIDDRQVMARADAKQISAETTLETDITDVAAVRRVLERVGVSAHRRLLADGRLARTVTVKLKLSDMSVISRSATLAAPSTDLPTLLRAAVRVLPDPRDVGAVRLVGVGFSGLSNLEQFTLFGADSDDDEAEVAPADAPTSGTPAADTHASGTNEPDSSTAAALWAAGMDVHHPAHGHGWVQGAGHGVVSVRFETRATGPGPMLTFRGAAATELTPADPRDSLAWDLTDEERGGD